MPAAISTRWASHLVPDAYGCAAVCRRRPAGVGPLPHCAPADTAWRFAPQSPSCRLPSSSSSSRRAPRSATKPPRAWHRPYPCRRKSCSGIIRCSVRTHLASSAYRANSNSRKRGKARKPSDQFATLEFSLARFCYVRLSQAARCECPMRVCRPSREGVARHRVLVPIQSEPRPAGGDHAVNRQQPFGQNGACNVQIFEPGGRRRDGHHMRAGLDKGVV